jgi:hypothetical protein
LRLRSHGIGDQNFTRKACQRGDTCSATALGPYSASRRRASLLAKPVGMIFPTVISTDINHAYMGSPLIRFKLTSAPSARSVLVNIT